MVLGKNANQVKGFLFDESAVTVYSAVFATPLILGFATRLPVMQIPTPILMLVLAFIFFLVSAKLSGYTRAIIRGISLGLFINALLTTDFGARLVARSGGLVVSG